MRSEQEDSGQVVIVLAIVLPILLLFMGLAIDSGMAYITRARLSKAVDAACLTGMKNLPLGQTTAKGLATHIFNANYGDSPPVPTITFPTDSGYQQVKVTATATVPTFFAQTLFLFWNVSDTAIATRGKLVMSLILDRSGSMTTNGGDSALQAAVGTAITDSGFINNFIDAVDEVAMVSFARNARVDVAINYNFRTPITAAVKNLSFVGGTFGTGGTYIAGDGPPLTLADHQILSVPIVAGENVARVAIYFTDGLMNTIQDTFNCPASKLINYGGFDDSTSPNTYDPTSATTIWGSVPTSGSHSGQLPYDSVPDYCKSSSGVYVTTFYSQKSGTQKSFTQANVTAESQYRAIATANAMRAETPGTFIYVIGLGSGVNSTTQAFLRQVANDPASTTYDSTKPQGLFLYVPDCPSTTCTASLRTAFQTIAAKILLRLTQ